jgi:Na+/H+ antiporter NhaD/arsenite permease-like protein
MISIIILVAFVIGYCAIAFEHSIKIDKAASALITGVICWVLLVLGYHAVPEHMTDYYNALSIFETQNGAHSFNLHDYFDYRLLHHVQEIASILFFLIGAMTIVELMDSHHAFKVITDRIVTTNKVKLLWIICILTFFLSAALDNLTTAIVMISLCRKLIMDQKTRWFFGGMIIIAANAGGAWSPIGDVTTTMLWIGGQATTVPLIAELFLCSLVCLVVPLAILSFTFKGYVERPVSKESEHLSTTAKERSTVFLLGIGGLLFVPIFKTVTHLPPFMGMMLSLSIIWIVTEIIHSRKIYEEKTRYSVLSALRKIDMPSVLFFLGILLAVAALGEAGQLLQLAGVLKDNLNNIYAINIVIGALSAIIDNVPLVAASMNMYPIAASGTTDLWLSQFVQDGPFWHFLAYTAGTGGSMLIIGSAAGVAVMGIEKIDFMWYLKKVSLWALIGYLAGCGVYIAEMMIMH